METSFKVVDNPGPNTKRNGVFLKYKAIAAITIVMLIILVSSVVLAAFLGSGRRCSNSKACDNHKTSEDESKLL